MSGQILHFDDSAHRAADALLPWFVNGTLRDDEAALVERHVRECARCRRELELLHQLQAICASPAPAPDPTPAFGRLTQRIDRRPWRNLVDSFGNRLLAPWRRAPGWAKWAIAAQFAGIVALAAMIALPGREPALYQTLGAPAVRAEAAGSIAVVFAPQITESDLRRVVQAAGARVVDGPTESNAYVLQVRPGHRDDALAALRGDAAVVLAEPLSARPDR